jgi:catechol 2,3-dioxygenase-like lactoylglutathione lyase family enzyme
MNTTDGIQSKLPIRIENITPILSVKDMTVSRNFYKNILGFEEADWGTDDFTSISRDKSGIYLCKGAQGNPGTWLWIGFDGDIIQLYNELKAKGVTIRQPPLNYSWALEMHVEDPDGHVLRFGTDPDYNKPFLDREIEK